MPAFDQRVSDFEAANTQVLGISTDSPFSHENWAKSVGISHYPLLSDAHRTAAKDYGVYWPDWNANVSGHLHRGSAGHRCASSSATGAASCPIPTRSWRRSRSSLGGGAGGGPVARCPALVVSPTPASTASPPTISAGSMVSPSMSHASSDAHHRLEVHEDRRAARAHAVHPLVPPHVRDRAQDALDGHHRPGHR